MSPVSAETLPDVLTSEQLAQLLGVSLSAYRTRRARRDWPYSPIPGFPATGKMARFSKAQVIAILNGQKTQRR